MLRCREGDQAIILAGPYIGFIVKVGQFIGDDWVHRLNGTRELHLKLWVIRNRDIERERGDRIYCPDEYLQPLRGPKTGQTTTTQKEIGA